MKLSTSKNKAWKAFSSYVRTRDCIKWGNNHPEFPTLAAACVTCNRVYPYEKLQAGHFLAGRKNSVLFEEKGVHAQCYGCNVGKKGNTEEYWLFMEREYGRDEINRQMKAKSETVKYTAQEYEEIAQKYLQMRLELLRTNSLH